MMDVCYIMLITIAVKERFDRKADKYRTVSSYTQIRFKDRL